MLKDFKLHQRVIGFNGIVSLIIGILIVLLPNKTAIIVSSLMGLALILIGVIYIGTNFSKKNSSKKTAMRIGQLFLGIVYLASGILVFSDLNTTSISLFILVGLFTGVSWIIDGIITLTTINEYKNKIWIFILSIVNILAGAFLIFSPLWGGLTLWLIFGIEFIIVGVMKIIHYYRWDK